MIEKPTRAMLYMDPIDDHPRRPVNYVRWGMAVALICVIVAEGVLLTNVLLSDS